MNKENTPSFFRGIFLCSFGKHRWKEVKAKEDATGYTRVVLYSCRDCMVLKSKTEVIKR